MGSRHRRPRVAAGTVIPLVLAMGVGLVASPTAGAAGGATTAQVRPDVIVVMADDMRADELRFLPAVRRLQRSGVTFTRALSADSLCCPARATLLTGKLAHNHRTIGNSVQSSGGYQVFAEHNDLQNLLPQWLDVHHYRTAWIGKYLNGFDKTAQDTQPDWTYFAAPVSKVYDYRSSHFAINGRKRRDTRYREVYARDLLLDRIQDWAPDRRPFFVLYSALAPHNGQQPGGGTLGPPRVQGIHDDFDTGRLMVRPSVGETDLSDKPSWLQEYAAGLDDPKTYPTGLERRRVEALLSLDDTVHDLVKTLRADGELGNTVLIFTSDNGFMLDEHDLGDKNKAYDESLNIPLVVRGPGFRGGLVADQTVSLADVTATIRYAAGVLRPHGADGLPLQDVLADPSSFDGRPVEIEGSVALYPDSNTLGTDAIGRFYTGAVWGPYSLIHYQTGDWEYYDRSTDPWQLENGYTDQPPPGSPQALLRAWYDAHVDCHGPACNDPIALP
jgi:N-acetylglucosamine-6-sulfatase